MDQQTQKQQLAQKAVDLFVKDNALVGIGTGTTVNCVIHCIGEKAKQGLLSNIRFFTSSLESDLLITELGLPLLAPYDPALKQGLSVYIDGADEISPEAWVLKGKGAAQWREKILAYNCEDFVILADQSKLVNYIGEKNTLPVSILPWSLRFVEHQLKKLNILYSIREGITKIGPTITDNGNIILELHIDQKIQPVQLENFLNTIPGVCASGLFTHFQGHLVYHDGQQIQVKSLAHKKA